MPHTSVPEEVILAVGETPELWPLILECRAWFKDARTGKVEILFGNGTVKDLQRFEHLTLGKAVELPSEIVPVCPICAGDVAPHDYGNKVYCERCDRVMTIWEIKQRHSTRARRPEEPPWSPTNGLARIPTR